MAKEVVLAGACRTAIGKFGGSLSKTTASELGAIVIKEAVERAGIKPSDVDEVLMGCVLQAGLGQSVARQAAVKAGLPVRVPAITLNNVCGSSLKGINMAAAMIMAGDADVIIAGGMESMSMAPYCLSNARFGYRMNDGKVLDTMVHDGLWDAFNDYHMGITAENVAERYGITRQAQDQFAARSQQRYQDALRNGRFVDEIVPVPIKVKKEIVDFRVDEHPRASVSVDALAALTPVFKPEGGTVTAANSSGVNDGASAVVVMSAEKAKALGVKPMARIVSYASSGVDPAIMGVGPVASCRKAFERAGLSVEDMDLVEANEAFAAQCIAVGRELGFDEERLNVNGGAIALGHPIGASGCRILVTLMYELRRRGGRYGLATLCVGGGMGVTTIVEMV